MFFFNSNYFNSQNSNISAVGKTWWCPSALAAYSSKSTLHRHWVSAVHVWMCQERWSLNLWGRVHKRVTPSVSVHVWERKGREDACVSALVQVHSCLCAGGCVCVCVRVCGPALHCAGGQNTRDCFDLDSLCLVQSQSCHRLPTAGATHSWCREETLLHVITLCTLYFTRTMFTKWLHLYPTEASQ